MNQLASRALSYEQSTVGICSSESYAITDTGDLHHSQGSLDARDVRDIYVRNPKYAGYRGKREEEMQSGEFRGRQGLKLWR